MAASNLQDSKGASASLDAEEYRQRAALILGGGGARAAYQVGVLKAIAEIVPRKSHNPFPIICGTSAGSINTVALASNADDFQLGVGKLLAVWSQFRLGHVFKADGFSLAKRIIAWMWSTIGFGRWFTGPASLLDNEPLRDLLKRYVNFEKIDSSISSGNLHAYCLTACSYTSGESTTFFDGQSELENWRRTHREGRRTKLDIDHLMASSAIPVVFPSVKIGQEFFGDGSMRQISPISPAVHLGADKILIVGLRMEAKLGSHKPLKHRPTLGHISGYILDTLFLNSLYADVERLERVNSFVEHEGGDLVVDEHFKFIEHLIISPSEDIADIALKHYKKLPRTFRIALTFLGLNRGNSRRFMSYLMFIEPFCQELIELGYKDAMRQRREVEVFLSLEAG